MSETTSENDSKTDITSVDQLKKKEIADLAGVPNNITCDNISRIIHSQTGRKLGSEVKLEPFCATVNERIEKALKKANQEALKKATNDKEVICT